MPNWSRNQRITSGLSGSPAEQVIAQLVERIALAGVLDAGHRPQRGGRGEHVLDPVLREEAQVLLGVVAALARLHERHRAVAPRPEQRADTGGPGPLAGAVEQLAVAHVVAELELLVREQVPVGVQNPPWPCPWCPTSSRAAPGRPRRCRRSRTPPAGWPSRRVRSSLQHEHRFGTLSTRRGCGARLAALVTTTLARESRRRCSMPSSP